MIIEDKILVCYNEPAKLYTNYLGKKISNDIENVDLSETDFSKQLKTIRNSLKKYFSQVELFALNGNTKSTIKSISEITPGIIFNFVESVEGNANYESYIAGLYEILGIRYTGSTPICLGNCLIKSRTKQILKANCIRTPDYMLAGFKNNISQEEFKLRFPVILKLSKEDASIGISEFSLVRNFKAMKKQLNFLFNTYRQDVIIEEYITGRELNVSILQDEALPISEITFNGLPNNLPKIVTYEAKWSPNSIYYKYTVPKCPADLDNKLKERIISVAKKAFRAMDCRDYARVDIRLSKRNIPFVIEVNPNPDISTDSGFARSAKAAGISYDELLYRIASLALKRKQYDTQFTEKGQTSN